LIRARVGKRGLLASLLATIALALGACGSADDEGPGNPESQATNYERALAGAPAPLAELYAQANELLDGGAEAYGDRLAELRGYPIVVNKWASWCGPCRAEFPFFQELAAERGKRIAFLGINSTDSDAAARTFLEELPVPYPSYRDPDHEIGDLLEGAREFPATGFYDSDGNLVYVRRGGYASKADLAADIDRYSR